MKNHNVLACEFTTPEAGYLMAVSDLLAQITTPFDTFMGEGGYDGEPVSQVVLNKQPNAKIVILPPKTAVISNAGDTQQSKHCATRAHRMAAKNGSMD